MPFNPDVISVDDGFAFYCIILFFSKKTIRFSLYLTLFPSKRVDDNGVSFFMHMIQRFDDLLLLLFFHHHHLLGFNPQEGSYSGRHYERISCIHFISHFTANVTPEGIKS